MNWPNRSDLHRHLDGSLRETTFNELAKKFNILVPENIFFKPNMTLATALSSFETSLAILQEADDIKRVAGEICEDAKAEGIDHLEIRFGPHLHHQKGLKLPDIIDATLEGIDNRAGLILCGLYGDDPKLLLEFVNLAKDRNGVKGIDLAGCPLPNHNFKMIDYKIAFTKARDFGIHRTVHAGEGRDASEIIIAVEELHAERIGHATTLLSSDEALNLVIEKEITIESCPTSNLQCGVIPSLKEHPIGAWIDKGVKVCINPDNTFFSRVNSNDEHNLAMGINLMNKEKILKTIDYGHQAIFTR